MKKIFLLVILFGLLFCSGCIIDDLQKLSWLKTHWEDVVAIYAGLVLIASIIVRWTPTLEDDKKLLKLLKFLSKYVALNRTVNDKEIRKELEKRTEKEKK